MPEQFRINRSSALPRLSDKCILPPSLLAEAIESHDQLPHPMVYLLNERVLIGVKEFTAPDNTILVPEEIWDRVGAETASCELQALLPKATSLSIRPTQFYTHVTNWKYYLESFLSSQYTTLSVNQCFSYSDAVAGVEVTLKVDAANAPLVIVVDTDIALDVVPLNDIMAAQQKQQDFAVLKYEEVSEIGSGITLDLEPLSTTRPLMYKINLLQFPERLVISMTSPQDLCHVDLVCSLDRFLSLENFTWSTMEQDSQDRGFKSVSINTNSNLVTNSRLQLATPGEQWLYVVPFAWEQKSAISLHVSDRFTVDSATSNEDMASKGKCGNCNASIDKAKLQLHEAFCYRNNVRCTCGDVFPKQVPATHWHCETCPGVRGNLAFFRAKHNRLFHEQPYTCDKCSNKTAYKTFVSLVQDHKSGPCASRLHECRFCHLVLPQGEATVEDRFLNLTHHEHECGNKTAECYQCGKTLRHKELASHMKIHELDRLEKNKEAYPKCLNVNCINALPLHKNEMALCETCYGPLYSSMHDPSNAKLQLRIERKYVLQLTKGCGHSWCQNKQCANGNEKLSLKEALARVKTELFLKIASPSLPVNAGKSTSAHNEVWFCVSESMQRKRNFVDALLSEAQHPENMIYKAVARQGVEEAQSWLMRNAV